MSQPIKSVSKLSRAVGEKLILKGARDEGTKNALTRKPYPPGQHGQNKRGKLSDYARQLREKQKARYIYYLPERQMRKIFNSASRSRKNTGTRLMQLLECRVDNILYRAGFADSRRQSRQFISHGLITINGKKSKAPSFTMKVGDTIKFIKPPKVIETVKKQPEQPKWIEVDEKNKLIKLVAIPERDQIATTLDEQLIVEYYSRLT